MDSLLEAISALAFFPASDRPRWLSSSEDGVEFLKLNASRREIVLYANGPQLLIHGVLAPLANVTPPDQEDLLRSFVQLEDSWCIQRAYGGGKGHRIYLEPPLDHPGCKSLLGGEKLIFLRRFDGVQKGPVELELSQKLVHSLALYYVAERRAYCRLDKHGDIQDVIRVRNFGRPDDDPGLVVTILAEDLFKYMALADMALVVCFDFTRYSPGNFANWDGRQDRSVRTPDLFYDVGVVTGQASFTNGRMIVRPDVTVEQLIEDWRKEFDLSDREYATFKIFDRKNKKHIETSCAPEFLSNYFQDSHLPWEISPAFFRADVLHRFKADPQKYTLKDRIISCRGAWSLKTYDINEAGQVHTYIGYLAKLPIEEQRYWQSFNEWPKAGISKRAHETDMLGKWSTEYDPLDAIKSKITTLDAQPPEWWKSRGREIADAARYPSTSSSLEWANEIMALDQLLVEGFLKKPLSAIAAQNGRTIDPQWGSLRILQDVLVGVGQTETQAIQNTKPLRNLHELRTLLRGHAAPDKRARTEETALAQYGTFRSHFQAVTSECDIAFGQIIDALMQVARSSSR